MFNEFKTFIARGNVVDLAVGIMIGAAFGKIVGSLTDDIIMPIIGAIFGKVDFSSKFVLLADVPESYTGSMTDYVALKAAGVPLLGYGQFITMLIDFLIIAFVLFLIVKQVNKFHRQQETAPAADPADVVLLREIRDELRNK